MRREPYSTGRRGIVAERSSESTVRNTDALRQPEVVTKGRALYRLSSSVQELQMGRHPQPVALRADVHPLGLMCHHQ